MNEQAIQDAYNLFVQTGYKGDVSAFSNLIKTNPNALNDSYNLFVENGYNRSYDDYKTLVGINQAQSADLLKKKGQGTMAQMVPQTTTESFVQESLSASQPKTQVAPKAQAAPKQKPGILAQPVPKTTTESFLATASAEPSIQPIGAKPKVAEKPKEEQKTGYLKTLYDNLALGASYANEAIFSLPETVINVLSIPQNYIAEKTGWNIGSNADILKEQLGIKNPILDWVQENQKVLNGEVAKNISDRYTDGGIVSNFSSGNYKDGFELLGASIAQSVPISIGFMLGGAYTAPAKLAAVSTLALTENQRQELEEMDPNMSESEKTMKALAMSGAESLFSSLGTGTIGKVYRDIAKKEGTEAAKGILKDGLVQTYKRALEKGGAVTGFVGEGIEEAATTITQNVISGKPAFEGAADAFVTGAGSGVVFTAPISAINAKKYIQNKIEVYDTKDKIGQILKDKADNIDKLYNVPVASEITAQQLEVANLPKSRDILVTNLKKSVAKGDITEDDAKQSLFVFDKIQQVSGSLSDLDVSVEDKAKIASLLKQRDELKIKTQNKDDVLVVAEKQQIEEINNQIQLIITKSKENAIQEQTAGQVPVQSETGTSLQVAEGEPQAEPQGVTKEVETEEVTEEKSQEIGTQIGDLVETFNTALQGGLDIGGTPNEKRARTRNSKKAYKKLKDFFGFEFGARENDEQASKQDALTNLSNILKDEFADVNEMMTVYREDKANGVASPVVQSIDTVLGITPAAAPQVDDVFANITREGVQAQQAANENQAQVETLRAQEQTELMEAIPNATQYVVDGKVDRTKITDPNDLETFDAIYDKYDKLITPLLQTTEVSSKTPTPKFVRDITALITPATVREFGTVTKRIKDLSLNYDRLVKEYAKTKNPKTLSEIKEAENQILNDAKQEIIDAVAQIEGVSVQFKEAKRGLWDGKFEPSFNMTLSISPQSDTKKVSDLLFDFSEKYSQDAFILETDSELEQDVIDGKRSIPLTEKDDNGLVNYPQIIYTFVEPITDEQVADLSLALEKEGIAEFSINNNGFQVSVITSLPEDNNLTKEEQYNEKLKDYKSKLESTSNAASNVFGSNGNGSLDIRIKKSSYNGAVNQGTKDQTRQFDRSDVLEAFKESTTKVEKIAVELANLRKKEIDLQSKGKQLSSKDKARFDELNKIVQPAVQRTFEVNKRLYEDAKTEVEKIANDAIDKIDASISPFPIKRPERASVKTIRWYNAFTEKLGDGARVNIVVNSNEDADRVFNEIDKKYKGEAELRRINEKTDLGYPKRLIEVRSSNGIISEIQVITTEAYLAKDGLSGFTGDEKQKTSAKNKLEEIRSLIGSKMPDGLGHYFYEIQRDINVEQSLRDEAKRLSKIYYNAFINPTKTDLNFSSERDNFVNDISEFKNKVDQADKSTWDAGNLGVAPKSLDEFITENQQTTAEEEEQYEPITVKDISYDTFTRDNASEYEEDEREGDNGRSYTYFSSISVPITNNQDGETIGYLVKMADSDGELTFDAQFEDQESISGEEGDVFGTLGAAREAFIEAYNKKKQEELATEATEKAKEKARETAKAAKKAAKAAAKEGAAKVEEVQAIVDDLLSLDENEKSTAQKISDTLEKVIKDIEKFEKTSLGVNVALPIIKGVIQAVKALVDAGISLQKAIKQVAQDNSITEQQVKDNINIAPILGGFGEVMTKVDALIARQKSKGITDAKIVSNVDTFIRNTEVYQAANDAQKKILEKEGRAKMGADERRAPSIGRVLGVLKDFTNISRQEKIQIIKQIRGLSQDSAKSLAKEIKEMANVGKITLNQAANIIAKFGKVNLLNERSVGSFVDYMSKVFNDAEYTAKLSEANRTKKDISKLAKNKDKNANLRDMAQQFVKINPSMVEDIDAYNAMAASIKEAIKGSTIRGQNVNFASTVNIENASEYISKTLAVQNEAIRQQKAEEIQELMGIDASKLSYEEMMSLLDSTEPITKYNEGIIRSTINKMFDTYSSIIKETLSTGKDQFTDEDVEFTKNQKDLVRRFMDMDLNLLKPKEALQAVDALNNFLNNKSTAKMEAVLSDYTGRKNATIVKGKKIVAQPLMKYYSKALGRFLGEQTTNLNVLFERMFKGVTRGGFVEDMSGVTMLKNKKSFAERQANNIVNDYVNEFYKTKANGEAFNTDYNNTERGIASFMMRNVIGTQAEMQTEFNRRKGLIEQSIDELSQGNELEQKKAELYKKAYDKVVKDSKNISDIKKKVDPKNLEAIDWWQNQWSDKYEQLSDVSENVYNKILDKDLNYTPDKFANLSFETGTVELSTEESAFHRNNGTIYKKETGVLMAATKPSNLPSNKNGDTSMYIDLSFDKNNSNSMYDALVDINTAAPIRQVESFLNSSDFKSIVPQAEDAKILKDRINLYVRNIRNKNPYTNDELSAAVRKLNKIAAIGVGQALGGVLQPVKQIVPVAMNTLINGGGLDISAPFNAAKTKFLNNSGYAIANRGIESQAQIESINKLIDLAAKSTGAKALGYLEQANKFWLKQLLVRPDVYVARASWMTYYEQSLKKQGIDPNGIDYNTHELNEQAGNYAQRMVDRQQNVSDADLSGKLFVNKESSNQLMVKMLMAFASFRMNQSARLGSDLAVMLDDTSTEEDRTIAARSLTGYAAEAVMFRAISAASIIAIGSIAKYALGMDEDDDEFKKRVNDVVKGQITGITTDLFSPLPIVDKGVQFGVNTALEQIQNALSISKEKQLNIYGVGKQSALQNLGMFGISAERVLQLVELVKLSTTGTYTDDFGNTKTISEEGQKALRLMIAPALLTNVGALPTEINSVIRNAVKFSKKKYKSAEDKAEAEERAVEKEETVEQKISTLESLRNFTDNPEEINAINKEIYELSADDETKAIIKEERKKERRVKESLLTNPETGEEYDNESDMKKYNPRLYNENFGPESQWYQDHKWEREIEKKMNKEITKAEEQEQGYVAPSRKRSGSSGFGPQKRSSSSGFGPQNKKDKSGFGPQD
jgi:hypothetical protein